MLFWKVELSAAQADQGHACPCITHHKAEQSRTGCSMELCDDVFSMTGGIRAPTKDAHPRKKVYSITAQLLTDFEYNFSKDAHSLIVITKHEHE